MSQCTTTANDTVKHRVLNCTTQNNTNRSHHLIHSMNIRVQQTRIPIEGHTASQQLPQTEERETLIEHSRRHTFKIHVRTNKTKKRNESDSKKDKLQLTNSTKYSKLYGYTSNRKRLQKTKSERMHNHIS